MTFYQVCLLAILGIKFSSYYPPHRYHEIETYIPTQMAKIKRTKTIQIQVRLEYRATGTLFTAGGTTNSIVTLENYLTVSPKAESTHILRQNTSDPSYTQQR